LQRGFDITKAEQSQGPYPIISSSGPRSSHSAFKVEPPGVVIGRKGSLGGVYFSETRFWPHDTTLWVKDFHGNDPKFVYYWLQTLGLEHYDVGAANPTLNRNHIHLLAATIPDIQAQRKIGAILSAYDDLIENNHRRITILEEMAQRIYREWFVDYRYPGHEDVPLADSKLGRTPNSWHVVSLSEVTRTQYGHTESATDRPVGPRFLRGMDINKASYVDWTTVPYCPIDANEHAKYRLARGDVVIIRMADPGKVGIIEADVDAVFASYLIRIKPQEGVISPYFLFYFLGSDRYQAFVLGASTGTTRKSLSAPLITSAELALPPPATQAAFVAVVTPLREQLNTLVGANATLRTMRDLLLPRLTSGEIDVADLDITPPDLAA